jgi:uncharacterized membrane protein
LILRQGYAFKCASHFCSAGLGGKRPPGADPMTLSTPETIIVALCAIGLADSAYVYYTQKTGRTLRCLIGNSCDIVTKSRYARTFGIDNSAAGAAYYAAVLAFILLLQLGIPVPWQLAFAASLAASLFSVYLVYLQLFVIRELCDWCMLSALLNWGISALLLWNHF